MAFSKGASPFAADDSAVAPAPSGKPSFGKKKSKGKPFGKRAPAQKALGGVKNLSGSRRY